MTMLMRSAILTLIAAVCCGWLIGCGGGGGDGGGFAAPSNLQASTVTTNSVTITWTDNTNGETGFEIERKTTGNWAKIATVPANTTQYPDAGLTQGVTYYYRVRALAPLGASGWSSETTATPGGGGGGGTGTVSGRVLSLLGNVPISGATVEIGAQSTATNALGQYTIANVPTGNQTLMASKTGYVFGAPVTIEVKAGANPVPDILLTPTGDGPPPPPPI